MVHKKNNSQDFPQIPVNNILNIYNEKKNLSIAKNNNHSFNE